MKSSRTNNVNWRTSGRRDETRPGGQNGLSPASLRTGTSALLHRADRFEPYVWAVGAMLCLALAIRLSGLDKGIWLDEYATLQMTLRGNFRSTLSLLRSDNHPPAYFLLLKVWELVGDSEQLLRLPSVFLGVATVATVVAWLRIYSRLASVLAGLLIATLPVLLQYSHEIRHYALLVFAVALSFFFASRVSRGPEKLDGYLGLALSLVLTVSSHLVGVMLLVPVTAFLILMASGEKRVDWKKVALALALPCAIFALFYLVYLKGLGRRTADWWMPLFSMDLASSTARYMLGISSAAPPSTLNQERFLVSTWLAGPTPRLLLLVLVALSSTLGNWRRSIPFLVAALLFFLQVVGYSILKTPIFWPRTILPAMIPLIGFIGLQVATIRIRGIKIVGTIALIGLSLIFAIDWITGGASIPTEAWRDASELLSSRWRPGDLVVFYPDYAKGPTRYYFPELPSEAIIQVKIGADIKKLDAAVDERLPDGTKDRDQHAAFLVVRGDLSVQKDMHTYYGLLSVLQSRLKEVSDLQVLLITCPDVNVEPNLVETRLELLSGLESYLGEPAWFQEFDLFALSEHKSLKPE